MKVFENTVEGLLLLIMQFVSLQTQHKINSAVQLNETKMRTLHEKTKTEHEKKTYCHRV